MKICIDTNTYTACKKGDARIIEKLEQADFIYIPSIVLGELYAGFYIGSYTRMNISELEKFLAVPGVEIAEVNHAIADRYGYLVKVLRNQGTPIPTNDIWIAATSLELNAKLLSFDKHFRHVPGIMPAI